MERVQKKLQQTAADVNVEANLPKSVDEYENSDDERKREIKKKRFVSIHCTLSHTVLVYGRKSSFSTLQGCRQRRDSQFETGTEG